ncbi:MAG TPA: acyl-CoA dehydrogenase [Candidatus Thermoplasmatota archaeon]|nr:acyl-CoA dehydrogenase [Candidatus Thermoplasmatota archaeon]
MDFRLSDEQEAVRKMVREFAEKNVAPIAAAIDREKRFPTENIPRMAELGLLGMTAPAEWGGAGFDYVSYVVALEELARACAATSVIVSVTNTLAGYPLNAFSNDAQKERFLRPLATGAKLGAFALSEPNAGSDPAAMTTVAVKKGGSYVLSGQKNFITNGGHAGIYVVFAKTDVAAKHRGISAFVVEAGTPGFTWSPPEDKMGIRAAHSTQLFFDNCEIPVENLLGQEGEGFKIAMATLDRGRIGIAAQAVGIAQACVDAAAAYAKERHAFGKPIAHHQAIQHMIADMHVAAEASRVLTWRAAFLCQQGEKFGTASAMAKLFASEAAMKNAIDAVQVHGGAGYTTDFPVERYMRDAKITEIYEGTSEIQRLVIARDAIGLK